MSRDAVKACSTEKGQRFRDAGIGGGSTSALQLCIARLESLGAHAHIWKPLELSWPSAINTSIGPPRESVQSQIRAGSDEQADRLGGRGLARFDKVSGCAM